jgi:hypothetical protein
LSPRAHPLPARFSRWLLACALRHWPEETRTWGTALAAEIDETTDAFETLLWSWGGIMLFARSVVASVLAWLKLPAGTPLPRNAGGGPVDPSILSRRSRLLTACVLIAAAVVVLSPEGREAIATVRASWGDFQQSPSDRRTLEKLAARGEKDNDAATLAFVALNVDDPERFTTLADRAVSLNPEFVWIYGATDLLAYGSSAVWEERLERLQASDPGNAVPVFLAAESVAERSDSTYGHLSPAEIEARLASNPKWMALMVRAFASPRYDSYMRRRSQLTSDVWTRERYLSPAVVFQGFWLHAIPNLGYLSYFSEIRIHEAEKAFAAGDLEEAERLLGAVDSLSERMVSGNSMLVERAVGLSLARGANRKLGELYKRAGRIADAQRAGLRVQQLEERQDGLWPKDARTARLQAFRRAGILVQGFGILAVLAGFAALAGILVLELWPARFRNRKTSWPKVLCWVTDYAPSTSLVASGALLLSFLPYARAFSEYRTSTAGLASQEALVEALSGFMSPNYYGWRAEYAFLIWSFVTVALATFATFIVARRIYRARV